jgi:hypothetical protein
VIFSQLKKEISKNVFSKVFLNELQICREMENQLALDIFPILKDGKMLWRVPYVFLLLKDEKTPHECQTCF